MRVQIFECIEKNSGQLTPVDGRFVCLKKRIYFFNRFGNKDSNTGFHVGFTWLQHQRFLFLQNRHWVQKEENIRYIVNVIFLIIGAYFGFKNLK